MPLEHGTAVRLCIYLGEEKRDGEQPLYEAIVRQARQMHIAGVTVYRGTQGYGRSTRIHTVDVLFSEDLPVMIEVIDMPEKIDALVDLLAANRAIGLITSETVTLRSRHSLEA